MKEILIFAGTTEGRRLSECLAASGVAHTLCVATEYGEAVRFTVTVRLDEAAALKKEVTEATNGKAEIEELEKIYFVDKE